jgi:hypothetical protein
VLADFHDEVPPSIPGTSAASNNERARGYESSGWSGPASHDVLNKRKVTSGVVDTDTGITLARYSDIAIKRPPKCNTSYQQRASFFSSYSIGGKPMPTRTGSV